MIQRYYDSVHHHLPQIVTASAMVLVFVLCVRWLGFVASDVAARSLSYGLLPLVCMACAGISRDINGLWSSLLITLVWCINTIVFAFRPDYIVHTAFLDLGSVAFLIFFQRHLVAGFSAAMVVVSVLIMLGFKARLVLDMLFLGQCVLLAMQNVPTVNKTIGTVVALHDSAEQITKKAS